MSAKKGFLKRHKWFILVPISFCLSAWLFLLLLTENKSIAPFVYAIF
jgi:hypothetical protein